MLIETNLVLRVDINSLSQEFSQSLDIANATDFEKLFLLRIHRHKQTKHTASSSPHTTLFPSCPLLESSIHPSIHSFI
jgi:hypothetical protein